MILNAKVIIEVLESDGISQNEFARRCDIQESSFSAMMNGKRGIGMKSLKKILGAFPRLTMESLIILG
ncbi:MAG: helix-turn-helix domain-containing protein [Clostridium sp.]